MNSSREKKVSGYYECPKCTWLFGIEIGDSIKCPRCGYPITDANWTDATDDTYDLLEELHLI